MKTPKALLFDADGVMTLPEEFFSVVYARSHGLDPEPFEEFFKGDWADFVTGRKDLKQHIDEHPELWQWNGDADSLIKYWCEVEDIRNVELIELIKTYRDAGLKCYMATEQEVYRGRYIKEVMFPDIFDGHFITSEIGLKKNDPDFYRTVLASMEIDIPYLHPEEIVFFDDSQSKLDAADAVGFRTVLYDGIECVQGALERS
jgi:putative hydrolase of the HAD superfamily